MQIVKNPLTRQPVIQVPVGKKTLNATNEPQVKTVAVRNPLQRQKN